MRVDVELRVALAIASVTDLVKVTVEPPSVEPPDLFALTFNDHRVGVSNEQMSFFKANLKLALPEAATEIDGIKEDARLNIGEVTDFVRAALQHAGVDV